MKKIILITLLLAFSISVVLQAQAPLPVGPVKKKEVKKLDVKAVSEWLAKAFRKVPVINKKVYNMPKYFAKVKHPEKFNVILRSQDNLRFVSNKTFEKDLPAVLALRCSMSSDYIKNDYNDDELKRYIKILQFVYSDYKELYSETIKINGLDAMRTLWTFKYTFDKKKDNGKTDGKEIKGKKKEVDSVLMVGAMINVYFLNFRYQFLYEVPAKQYYKFRGTFQKFVKNTKIKKFGDADKNKLKDAFKLLAEKKFKKAFTAFEKAVKSNPDFYPALEGKYYSYLGAGKEKEGLALLQKSQEKFPAIDNFYLKEFDYYKARKDENSINKLLKKVFESDLNSSLFYTEAAFYLATKPQVKEKLIKALLNLANNKDPLNSMAWSNTAKYFMLKGKYIVAEAFLSQVLKLDPTNKALWIHISEVYLKIPGMKKKSIEALRKLAYLYSEDVDSLTLLANALVKDNQIKVAVQIFNKVFSLDPDYIPALTTVGLNMYQMKDYKNALNCFENIHKQRPEDFHVMNYAGMCYYFLGNDEKAKKMFNKMIKQKPDIDFGYMGLGLLYSRQEKLKKAIKCFDKVLELNPNNRYASQMKATVVRNKFNKK
ncbi:tetratricopeptide repeat protein [bacterium]|nr:tetratricopeptide repeat protein [bacterium]